MRLTDLDPHWFTDGKSPDVIGPDVRVPALP
jgi:hypothetical protein